MGRKRVAAAKVFQAQNVAQMVGDAIEPEDNEFAADLQEQAIDGDVQTFQKQSLERRARRASPPEQPAYYQPPPPPLSGLPTSEELQMEKEPIRVRETRFLFWRWVVVPPSVYVVHTRSGRKEPVTIGLGLSFRYRPNTDSYLVVPAAMQTIGIVANCISKEKQGLNILAYVQWQIEDFNVAYKKLDFSDSRDPLGIVNAQLREQAEAAIKDKIATMSIEEVLTDKEPIIEELTTRLKAVAEGRLDDSEQLGDGLGIKIVTVQIKEAVVSSQRLWENLQAPFRNEKEQAARMSYLEMQEQIRQRELESRQQAETSEAETQAAIELSKQRSQTEAHQARLNAEGLRYQNEVEAALSKLAEEARLNAAKLEAEQAAYERRTTLKQIEAEFELLVQGLTDQLEIARQSADLQRQQEAQRIQLELEEAANQVRLAIKEREAEIDRIQQEIRNLASDGDLTGRLIDLLPELASNLPEADELHILQTGGDGSVDMLAGFLMNARAIAASLGLRLDRDGNAPEDEAQ